MKTNMNWYACVLFILFVGQAFAQSAQEEYIQVITKRSEKIISTLGITDSTKFYRVRDVLASQYAAVNAHHEEREEGIKKLKAEYAGKKEVLEEKRTQYEAQEDAKLMEVHKAFLEELDNLIQPEQIEKVKDGMTYGVLPLTYKAYQDMIPSLTVVQKEKILAYLTEARELAMDAPGSKEKHGVFGKFKGRINNYLSAEGYDLQDERRKWQERSGE